MSELHPTEHRGYRELYAFARQLVRHWDALAERLPEGEAAAAVRDGADGTRRLLEELRPLTSAYGLYGEPAAQGTGARIAAVRTRIRDRAFQRDQAVRFAVSDLQHVTTLLLYLAAVADSRGDERLADFCRRWERSLRRAENAVRRTAAAMGSDPDAGIEPLDASPLGRAVHRAAYVAGSLGEWFDRRRAERDRPGG